MQVLVVSSFYGSAYKRPVLYSTKDCHVLVVSDLALMLIFMFIVHCTKTDVDVINMNKI